MAAQLESQLNRAKGSALTFSFTELHRATGPAVTAYVLRADVGGTELQSFISCAYGDSTALLWAAQGCRVIHGLRLWRLPYAAVGGRGLRGYISRGCGDYSELPWAAQGCRASLSVAIVTTLRGCGRRRAAGLHCLRL